MIPAVLCIVAAALLGGWGWGARDDSSATARVEADRRSDDDEGGLFSGLEEPDGPGGEVERDPVTATCDLLISAALLEPPLDPFALFGPLGPDGGSDDEGDDGSEDEDPVTTLAPSGLETAQALRDVLREDLVTGIPELDHPDLVAAVDGLRGALQVAASRTAEPLADPDVIAAAAALRSELVGRCL